MKSAYELAMERLQKISPSKELSAKQKEEIAEIDSLYKSKIAEKEVFLNGEIQKAQASGKFGEIEELRRQLASESTRLKEECETRKDRVRNSA